ncbi:MAG: hypothetical protein IIZ27_01270 [Solobacterium sp.]|nr:hypothetical protein [Solobacterium sp.]
MKKLSELTSRFVYDAYHLNDDMVFIIREIDAKELLNYQRLDVIAKLMYLELREKCPVHAEALYLEHIRVMTRDSFVEAGSNKSGKEAFLKSFQNLYEDMKEHGYREDQLPIPVDKDMCLMDGAHRTACAIALNKPVTIIQLPVSAEYDCYDYQYFRERTMEESYLDEIVLEYIRRSDHNCCINLWPSAKGHDEEARALIDKYFTVFYEKEVTLNENGAFHYLAQIYKEYSWAQNHDQDGFSGVYRKLVPCFPTFDPVKVFFVKVREFDSLVQIKEEIRDVYHLEKHSMHATDNDQETREMAEILLSGETIHFLNACQPLKFPNTFELLAQTSEHDPQKTIYTGSIVLALYGIRQAEDLDYLSLEEDENSHNKYLDLYEMTLEEAFHDPGNSFVYFDNHFLTLDVIKNFKKNRDEGKDRDDLKLIDLVLSSNGLEDPQIKKIQARRRRIAKIQGVILKTAHKTGTYDLLRKIYHVVKGK